MQPTTVRFDGRRLFLTASAAPLIAQLNGTDFTLATCGALRDHVSTDEITPTTVMTVYDERMGDYPYVGLRASDTCPIGRGAIKAAGFEVVVAGKRYGKGSSREHSPLAERSAGIRLIVAESFERIYRQNAHNLGLLTSTDLGLVERIDKGENIPLDEFTKGQDDLTSRIIRAGGLLALARNHRREMLDAPPHRRALARNRPRSYAQKLIEHAIVEVPGLTADSTPEPGDGVLLRTDWRFSHEYFTGMAEHLMHQAFGSPAPVLKPERIVAFQDHLTYVHRSPVHKAMSLVGGVKNLAEGHLHFVNAYGVHSHGALDSGEGSEGICHAMMAERYAAPGQVVVGTDSHTPHSGAVGALAFGAGATDIACAWVTGLVRTRYPKVCRVQLCGRREDGVAAKDIVLEILRHPFIASGEAIGMVVEFEGDLLAQMSTDERATLTNMVAEMGGFTGVIAPDQETVRFLRERRGIEFTIEDWMRSDEGAIYDATLVIDCAKLEPMFAAPGDPGNGVAFSQLPAPVPIDIAYGGSCTAGKRQDFDEYFRVLNWARENGMRVAPRVKLYLQFGTLDVMAYCQDSEMLPVFEAVGAEILMPACGACANCGPGSSSAKDEVTVSAINRNFPGRSGPGKVWLASPASVAASAIAGELTTFEALKLQFAG
jgi:3-isopropylmalate/(R)-2-methylmalate dehydratase large subunit